MRRTAILATVALLAISISPIAQAGAGGQEVSGTIVFPIPDPQDTGATCFQGVERRINMVNQNTFTGLFGYVFDVDKKTWNKKFTVEPTGGGGTPDLDIYFYLNFGPGIPDDPSMNGPSFVGEFTETKAGGEAGAVPKTATKALVCMKGSVATSFEYVAK